MGFGINAKAIGRCTDTKIIKYVFLCRLLSKNKLVAPPVSCFLQFLYFIDNCWRLYDEIRRTVDKCRTMSRTAYLSKLRRAFLLRVHPDRFRHHTTIPSEPQASLVKALTHRMSQADFTAWLQQRNMPNMNLPLRTFSQPGGSSIYPFVMEKRDGSLLQSSLSLNGSVVDILNSMAIALKRSGVGSVPILSKEELSPAISPSTSASSFLFPEASTASIASSMGSIDSRYDVRSNQGRNLQFFLQDVVSLSEQIRELRAARIDAMAIASQVRRVFSFAAVDATETGWSSASAVVLFRRLLALHEEFSDKFHVKSFYPIRLVFSPRDIPDDRWSALDLHGGILRLNPASTSIQWLEALQLVSEASIQQIHRHQELSVQRTKLVRGALNIRLSKGFTSSSKEYYAFLEKIAGDQSGDIFPTSTMDDVSSSLPTLEPIQVVIEADSVCRRGLVTSSGVIRLGSGMSKEDCIYWIHRLARSARDQALAEKGHLKQCQSLISNVKWQFGLQKVYRIGNISHSEYHDCLSRFQTLSQLPEQYGVVQSLLHALAGNALGISTAGQSCQLADDGSVVIPHNWT